MDSLFNPGLRVYDSFKKENRLVQAVLLRSIADMMARRVVRKENYYQPHTASHHACSLGITPHTLIWHHTSHTHTASHLTLI